MNEFKIGIADKDIKEGQVVTLEMLIDKEPIMTRQYADSLKNTIENLQIRNKELEELIQHYKFILEGHKLLAMPKFEQKNKEINVSF